MPTSTSEAQSIQEIMNDYLSPEDAHEITSRLEAEVGRHTDNDSLKVSLEMLKQLYSKQEIPHKRAKLGAMYTVAIVHGTILLMNLASIAILPFYAPWYIALPLVTLLINLMFSPVACPLTRLESRFRKSVDYPEVRYFMKYYVVDPLRGCFNRRQ